MKYLIIDGSPDKSSTRTLSEQIKTEIMCVSNSAVFKEVRLSQTDLPFCTGCSQCLNTSRRNCPHSDIVSGIIRKIDWCDGVVLVTSVINMQPAALTKNLIDHFYFLRHRPGFFSKKALVIASDEEKGAKRAVKYLAGTLRSFGFNKCLKMSVNSLRRSGRLDYKTYTLCEKTAKKFHTEVSMKIIHSPSWIQVMDYNRLRRKYRICRNDAETETYNFRYWTEPYRIKKAYDPSVPLPFYKAVFGSIFCGPGKAPEDRSAGVFKE